MPTDQPPAVVNATFEGTVQASSVYRGFPASLAVDGDRSSSWFSAGTAVDGSTSVFQWTGRQSDLISTVSIASNEFHSNPDFRTGFGFESVVIQVLDAQGKTVFESKASLAGTPDPNVSFKPGVVGQSVRLLFSGHESAECGGFSELQVLVSR